MSHRRKFPEAVQEDGGIAMIRGAIHVRDRELQVRGGGGENRGEGLVPRDERREGERVSIPGSDHPTTRAAVNGMVGANMLREGGAHHAVYTHGGR